VDDLEIKHESYIDQCEDIWNDIKTLDKEYWEKRNKLKKNFALKVEEGKIEADLQITSIAERVGVSRQTIHKIITEVFGVRHFDKAKAGTLGRRSPESYV
jgi:DNA-binding XRE family transcriptional regulator